MVLLLLDRNVDGDGHHLRLGIGHDLCRSGNVLVVVDQNQILLLLLLRLNLVHFSGVVLSLTVGWMGQLLLLLLL